MEWNGGEKKIEVRRYSRERGKELYSESDQKAISAKELTQVCKILEPAERNIFCAVTVERAHLVRDVWFPSPPFLSGHGTSPYLLKKNSEK
jgi:precorrin-6x reductase